MNMAKGEGVINNGKKNEEAKNYGQGSASRQGKRAQGHNEICKDESWCAQSIVSQKNAEVGFRREITKHTKKEIQA